MDIGYELRRNNPGFDINEFTQGLKLSITQLYKVAKRTIQGEEKYRYNEKIIKKMIENSDKFRLNFENDRAFVQYVGVRDYKVEEENYETTQYIQVSAVVNIYDDVDEENNRLSHDEMRCWCDRWILVLKKDSNSNGALNCENCGATMSYNPKENMLSCDYCRNRKFFIDKWQFIDIDVEEDENIRRV